MGRNVGSAEVKVVSKSFEEAVLFTLPSQESERKAVEVVRKGSGSAPSASQARVQEEGGRGRQKRFW